MFSIGVRMSDLIVLLLNRSLHDQLFEVFTNKGFHLSLMNRAECSKESIASSAPDIVLFDVGMHSEDDFLLYLDIVRWSNVPVLPVIYRKENSHCTMLQAQELLKDVESILLGTDYADQKDNLARVREYPYALTHYHDIFETIPYAVFIHDIHTGAVLDVNVAATELFGYSRDELMNENPAIAYPKNTESTLSNALKHIDTAAQQGAHTFEWCAYKKSGQLMWLKIHLSVVSISGINQIMAVVHDITRERQLQKALEASEERFKAVFEEFSDGLMIIDEHGININSALVSASQAADLVKKLLSVSRKTKGNVEKVLIQEVINDVKTICQSSFPKIVHVFYEIDKEPVYVNIDKVLLTQALINCCINASHAVTLMRNDGREGGTITVKCTKATCAEQICAVHPEANRDTMYAVISIRDDGVGMDEETRRRIFEPFFSTKDKSVGTGLGLSIVYSTITNAGGFIHVESALGKGTTVSLYLPAA